MESSSTSHEEKSLELNILKSLIKNEQARTQKMEKELKKMKGSIMELNRQCEDINQACMLESRV